MSKERIKTIPDLSLTSEAHIEAKKLGDEHFRLWQRNVIDEFKELSEEVIKQKLQSSAFPYAIAMESLINDFNISSVFRNANAFNAKEVFYIGDKKFDKRGLLGCHNYMDIHWLPTIDDFIELSKRYRIVGIDNVPRAFSLKEYKWQPDTLVVFGSEGVGLTPAMLSFCQDIVYIPQYGSVRSLNVATASGIIMNDIVNSFNI
jgi:tRNA G18 (ribose-2'-O)-methylase SpoU